MFKNHIHDMITEHHHHYFIIKNYNNFAFYNKNNKPGGHNAIKSDPLLPINKLNQFP